MRFKTAEVVLSAAVASGGTITFQYPEGTLLGSFRATSGHKLWVAGHQKMYTSPTDFTVAFGANIVVTYNGSTAIPAGTRVNAQFIEIGDFGFGEADSLADIKRTGAMKLVTVNLGAPATADVNGIFEAYSGAAPALDGALVTGGVAILDVPRNIVVDSGGADTAVLTFTGTDEYGNTVVESITLNGTTAVGGKKAFKTVTGVTSSATISNGAFAGPGDVLGLPIAIKSPGQVIAEMQDGANATAGTVVAAATATATATTGDVRGTYDPNAAADGSRVFELLIAVDDIETGVAQYAG